MWLDWGEPQHPLGCRVLAEGSLLGQGTTVSSLTTHCNDEHDLGGELVVHYLWLKKKVAKKHFVLFQVDVFLYLWFSMWFSNKWWGIADGDYFIFFITIYWFQSMGIQNSPALDEKPVPPWKASTVPAKIIPIIPITFTECCLFRFSMSPPIHC